MPRHVSLYDAKARLSAIVRAAGRGERVVITVRGTPMAAIGPLPAAEPGETLAARLDRLAADGTLQGGTRPPSEAFRAPVSPRRTGALQRFLDDR
ncbi:MAG: type II toxin-antitoxin system prevent-host-death family antitoxin [Gemmatimonadales bacterium]|nr:type II toxin-antitoxin system prevent-host-death family antitoxin [Gemmatimonadales bacterium]